MKKLLIILLSFFFFTNSANSQSRFGELTEMRDEKMRGKDNQWVRPHPGPFIWNHIEQGLLKYFVKRFPKGLLAFFLLQDLCSQFA